MEDKTILYEKHDRVAKVILNRPRYKNAQSRVMLEEMDAAFADGQRRRRRSRHYSRRRRREFLLGPRPRHARGKRGSGAPPFPKGVRGEYTRSRQMFLDNTLRWRDLDKPTIAQVQGLCIFGGWMFAAAMDLGRRVRRREVPARAAAVLFDSVGHAAAQGQGNSFPEPLRRAPKRRARLGFVNMVVPRAQLEERNDGAGDANRGERPLHAPDGQVGGEFGAGRDGIQHLDSQRPFASHGARNGRAN